MVDEELLKPSREYMAFLRAKIAAMEDETRQKIDWRPDDKERARELWHQFSLYAEPIRREIDAIGKVITDYYALQPAPPPFIVAAPSS